MLSFLVSIMSAAIIVVLFFFLPWKLFFFFTGLVVVEPQNFVLRKLKERGRTPQFIRTVEAQAEKQEESRLQQQGDPHRSTNHQLSFS